MPARIDDREHQYAALVLRVGLGVVFVAHALMKVFVLTMPGSAAFFEAHGFPGWTAYPVTLAELAGGTLLIAGVRTRLVALGLVPVMLGAITVHWPNGWSFFAEGGGWEYVAFLIVALVAQALLGDGAWSLAALRRRRPASIPGLSGGAVGTRA
jgi:putative oxidoreductase